MDGFAGDIHEIPEQLVSDYVEIHDALLGYGPIQTADFCRYSRMRREGATQRAVLWQIAMDRTDRRMPNPVETKPAGQSLTRLTESCEDCAQLRRELSDWKLFGRLATLITLCVTSVAVVYAAAIAVSVIAR